MRYEDMLNSINNWKKLKVTIRSLLPIGVSNAKKERKKRKQNGSVSEAVYCWYKLGKLLWKVIWLVSKLK